MEISIQELLKKRIEASKDISSLEKQFILESKEYNKKWAEAVQHFQLRINKDQLKDKKRPYPFMAIRTKLEGVREIDDLRWFYKQCIEYTYKKDKFGRRIKGNTFNKCFFGALKITRI